MSASQIFAGLALIIGLAVACQILAARLRIPAIIVLLPVGFAAGAATTVVNPDKIFGAAFSPLVSLAVAIILFDGGLDLAIKGLAGRQPPRGAPAARLGHPDDLGQRWLFRGPAARACPGKRPSCSARS